MGKWKVFLGILALFVVAFAGCRENKPDLKVQSGRSLEGVSVEETEKIADLGPNASIVTEKQTDTSEDARTGANTNEGEEVTAVKVQY